MSALVARRVAAVQRKRQLVSEGAGEAGFARQCWLGANGTGSKSSGGKQYMYLLTSTERRKENAVVCATVDSASGMQHRTQYPVRHLAERMDSDQVRSIPSHQQSICQVKSVNTHHKSKFWRGIFLIFKLPSYLHI